MRYRYALGVVALGLGVAACHTATSAAPSPVNTAASNVSSATAQSSKVASEAAHAKQVQKIAAEQRQRQAEIHKVPTVTYRVTGSSDAQVTYGPAGSNYTGSSPMDVTNRITATPPDFFALSAQLQGGGQVTCEIAVNGKVISEGEARGAYNIADCEISQDPISGGWDDDNS